MVEEEEDEEGERLMSERGRSRSRPSPGAATATAAADLRRASRSPAGALSEDGSRSPARKARKHSRHGKDKGKHRRHRRKGCKEGEEREMQEGPQGMSEREAAELRREEGADQQGACNGCKRNELSGRVCLWLLPCYARIKSLD